MKKHIFYGLIFLALEIMAIIRNYISNYTNFLWFCDFAPLLFAVAFFLNHEQLKKALINIGLFAQIGYFIIFFYNQGLFIDENVIGFGETLFYVISGLVVHTSSLLALSLSYKSKPKIESLLHSFFIIMIMYVAIINFTAPENNINYIFSMNPEINLDIPNYSRFWAGIVFFVAVLPAYFLQYALYKISKRT